MRLTEKDWKDKRAGYPWTVHPVESYNDLKYYLKLAEYEDAAEEQENNKKLNESYRTILNNLIKNHKYELLEMYTRDECAYDFEFILSALGISSNILDQFQP